MPDPSLSTVGANEWARLSAAERARKAAPAGAPAEEAAAAAAPVETIDAKRFAQDAHVPGAETAAEREALAKQYDVDGQAGLSEAEFSTLFAAQAEAASNAAPPRPTAAQMEGHLQAYDAALRGARGTGAARLDDPAVKAAAAKLYGAMDAAVRNGDTTMAMAAQDQAIRAARQDPANPADFATRFTEARAAHAFATSESAPKLGLNNGKNPAHSAAVQHAGPGNHAHADMQKMAEHETAFATAALQQQVDQGYTDLRAEMDATRFPPPDLAAAYDAWKADDTYPNGKTLDDFKAHLQATGADQKLAPASKALLADGNKGYEALAYYQVAQAQLKAYAAFEDQATVNLVLQDLGDYDNKLGGGAPFQAPAAGSPEQKWVDEEVAKTRLLAEMARKAGVDAIELGNEPNLQDHRKGEGNFWANDPTDPKSMANGARRYGYMAGSLYNALKDPKAATSDMTVNMAAMGFTNPPATTEAKLWADPLVQMTDAQIANALPGASDADKHEFRRLVGEYARHHGAGASDLAEGVKTRMWALYDKARKQADPAYDPLAQSRADQNGVMDYLAAVRQAQNDFFKTDRLPTDQANIHLYGSPERNEALLKDYGKLADEGVLPRSTALGEYGNQDVRPDDRASDLYSQTANTVAQMEANGLVPTSFQLFHFGDHDHKAWGNTRAKNPRMTEGNFVEGPGPVKPKP